MMMINDHDHQGAATDVPDGEGNTSVHAAVSGNCKATQKFTKTRKNLSPLLDFVRENFTQKY